MMDTEARQALDAFSKGEEIHIACEFCGHVQAVQMHANGDRYETNVLVCCKAAGDVLNGVGDGQAN